MLSRAIKSSSASAASTVRYFSTSRAMFIESGSNIGRDSFHEKERAQENVYIKKHEAAQLKKLKEKLQQQEETINKLEKELDDHKNSK